MRNRERTQEALLEALEAQIREEGILRSGINSVAARAGVSKELIYRYFGGMDGLILEMMSRQDYWTRSRGIPRGSDEGELPPAQEVRKMLRDQLDLLLANPIVQEVRRWELIEPDETRQKLAKRREAVAQDFIARIAARDAESGGDGADAVDIPATTGLILAGLLYLVLRSKTEDQFLGVSLRDPEGWERFRGAIDHLIDSAFPAALQEQGATPDKREDETS